MQPNGSPRKSVSVPARITRRPAAASDVARSTIPTGRNCASSMATTCVSFSTACAICSGESIGSASTVRPSWLDTWYRPAYRSSRCDLNTCTRFFAISARRTRRMSSSLLPLNITPQITSIQPPPPGGYKSPIMRRRAAAEDVWDAPIRRRGRTCASARWRHG